MVVIFVSSSEDIVANIGVDGQCVTLHDGVTDKSVSVLDILKSSGWECSIIKRYSLMFLEPRGMCPMKMKTSLKLTGVRNVCYGGKGKN